MTAMWMNFLAEPMTLSTVSMSDVLPFGQNCGGELWKLILGRFLFFQEPKFIFSHRQKYLSGCSRVESEIHRVIFVEFSGKLIRPLFRNGCVFFAQVPVNLKIKLNFFPLLLKKSQFFSEQRQFWQAH